MELRTLAHSLRFDSQMKAMFVGHKDNICNQKEAENSSRLFNFRETKAQRSREVFLFLI